MTKETKPELQKFEIKNRWTGETIYSGVAASFEALILAAIATKTNLTRANLTGAYLTDANLTGAYLTGAYLTGAYLTRANLTDANLTDANLTDANLTGAYLTGANLTGAKGIYPIVPEEGSFVGFKKLSNNTIAKLLIPENAGRVGGYTERKCRAERAIVIEGTGFSKYDDKFGYAPGKTVTPDSWDPDPRVTCSHGIHFFLTRAEAQAYD